MKRNANDGIGSELNLRRTSPRALTLCIKPKAVKPRNMLIRERVPRLSRVFRKAPSKLGWF